MDAAAHRGGLVKRHDRKAVGETKGAMVRAREDGTVHQGGAGWHGNADRRR